MEALPDLPAKPVHNESDGSVQLTAPQAAGGLSDDLKMLAITNDDYQPAMPPNLDLKSDRSSPERAPPPDRSTASLGIALRSHVSTHIRQNSDTPDSLVAEDTQYQPAIKPSRLSSTLERGDLAASSQPYSPILAISKYPYLFVEKRDSQKLATAIFDNNKFWERGWELYYAWPIDGPKPLILITEDQVQALLDDINRRFRDLGVKITDSDREQGLVARFPNHPRFIPRYLGRISSKFEFDDMAARAPDHRHRAPGEGHAPPPDERTLEAFKQIMEDMAELAKGKNKAKREKQKQVRKLTQQNMAKQLKRAQRYLGLRPKRPDFPDPLKDSSLSWEQIQKAQAERNTAFLVPPHNPELPCPWPCDASVIFIAVDIEAYERDNSKITEIGVSTLDTLDIVGVAPGVNGENWLPMFRNRHFLIREHSHLHNTEFVSGCAHAFEFGTSETIRLLDAAQVVKSCFEAPYSAPSNHPAASSSGGVAAQRNIILLGHDTGNDVRYMQKLGFNVLGLENLLEVLDTADMFRAWKRESNPRSLGTVLLDFDIPGWNLHNAGNDARYTMQAMVAIAVKEASLRGKGIKIQHEQEILQRILEAQKVVAEKTKEENEGWSSAEEGDDGGAPIPAIQAEVKPAVVPQTRVEPPSPDRGGNQRTASEGGGNRAHGQSVRGGWSDRGRGERGRGNGRGRGRGDGSQSLGNFPPRGTPHRGGFGRGRYTTNGEGNGHSDRNPSRGRPGHHRGTPSNTGSDPSVRGYGRGRARGPSGW